MALAFAVVARPVFRPQRRFWRGASSVRRCLEVASVVPASISTSSSTKSSPAPGRRAHLLAGVASLCATALLAPDQAMALGQDPAATLTRRGMAKFTQGDVDGSISDFDLVIVAAPTRAPYLWQRGLSLFYAERYQEGSAQFRKDVAVNPNDTEEAVWAFLCEARDPTGGGFETARANLLKVGRDGRPYMRAAYDLFAGVGGEDSLRATADGGGAAEDFYSWLYVSLYREAKGDDEGAKTALVAAMKTPYGNSSGDYMAALAEVHLKRRGWG
jgi:tetratricopeptide (TPR) repeat protein